MKTFKTLLSIFALAAVFSTGAMAQETINATATVIDALSFGTHESLAFGEVITEESATIAADSSAAGHFEVTGYDNSKDVDVSVAKSSESGPATLTLATLRYGFQASADPTGTTSGVSGAIDLATQTNNLYLYVGGTLVAGSTGGSYTSTVTLTIDYTN